MEAVDDNDVDAVEEDVLSASLSEEEFTQRKKGKPAPRKGAKGKAKAADAASGAEEGAVKAKKAKVSKRAQAVV